jgi:ribulose 1,5-bisphosphate synthetase/thiazole synthase
LPQGLDVLRLQLIMPRNSRPNWSYEVDVIVIGASAMGFPAAIVTHRAGAAVIVIGTRHDSGYQG